MKFTQNSLLKVQHASDAFDRQLMHTLISTSCRGHTRSILLRLGSTLEEGDVKGPYIITFSKNSICMRYNILYTTLYTRIQYTVYSMYIIYSHFMDLSTEILICPDDTEACQTLLQVSGKPRQIASRQGPGTTSNRNSSWDRKTNCPS